MKLVLEKIPFISPTLTMVAFLSFHVQASQTCVCALCLLTTVRVARRTPQARTQLAPVAQQTNQMNQY